ncbi:DUF2165 domain-containing protein [Mycolicibacterium sp.]|uniref:DUF2165 domain-containing protein n=1 Tax=Mycolicibacterium sp. TaxID=2320850 RepID=UPI0028AA738D|nr:DUF2165 domain-containing protein [Mycolicibacterium sp.]
MKDVSHADETTGLVSRLGTLQGAAGVVIALNALYMLLVAFGNITDFDTNRDFVEHVMSMDTTNFGNDPGIGLDRDVMWHAITSPVAHTIGYIGVIAWESLTALILVAAAVQWFRSLKTGGFDRARSLATVGLVMIVMLFFGGFTVVGGEWFQMWRSTAWNGLDPAFRNATLALFGLVLIHLPSHRRG